MPLCRCFRMIFCHLRHAAMLFHDIFALYTTIFASSLISIFFLLLSSIFAYTFYFRLVFIRCFDDATIATQPLCHCLRFDFTLPYAAAMPLRR